MKSSVSLIVLAVALIAAPISLGQGDEADRKLIKRLLPEMELVPSLYATGEEPIALKSLPKFSATKMLGYPISKKATAAVERDAWKPAKETYAKQHPLRAAIFEAMDETDKLKELDIALTVPATVRTIQGRGDFLAKQEPLGRAIFGLENAMQTMKTASEKRDAETSRRWQANFDLAHARMLGNLLFLYEYSYMLGQIRADKLPELGKDDDGWRLEIKDEKLHVPEGKAKQYAKERGQLLKKMQEDYAGTPWAYFAERDAKRPAGMEWVAKKK